MAQAELDSVTVAMTTDEALRKAELISPARVQCHPFVREVLGELLMRSRRDAVGRELRGMAYRAGLPV